MDKYEYQKIIREKYLVNGVCETRDADLMAYDALIHTGAKILEHFGSHNCISISVSGGSDSDCIVHLVCTYFPEFLDKCHFVFVNTGLEYSATKRHLNDLEQKYGITIDRIRGKSVVTVVREHGVPILSKLKAQRIDAYLRGTEWGKRYLMPDEEFKKKFRNDAIFSDNQLKMVAYCKEHGIKISDRCCYYSKKKPLHKYQKDIGADLVVTGERKAEGGQRSYSHSSCFEQQKTTDKFMPLWWWSDETKDAFKKAEEIRYSDCYEVYGFKRTGCVGCPFNLKVADTLQAMYVHEPQLYKACMNVFGIAYELTDRFNCRKKKCLPDSFQMTLTGEIERSEAIDSEA